MSIDELCDVYRSNREEGVYLYVLRSSGLAGVPEVLLQKFGKPEVALTLTLKPGRKLARCNADDVLKAIDEQGFYLQLPPRPDECLSRIDREDSKL